MLEFRIVIQQGKGRPYSLYTYNNFNQCYNELLELIKNRKNCVNKKYYVANDFFDNEYEPTLENLILYNIQVREVSVWKDYTENANQKNNVVYFR